MTNIQKTTQCSFQVIQALVVLTVAWIFMGAPVYLTLNYPQTPPPSIYAALMLTATGLFYVVSKRVEQRITSQTTDWLPRNFFRTRLGVFIWLLFFILLAWLSLYLHGSNSFATEDLSRRISSSVFLCVLLVLLTDKNVRCLILLGVVLGSIALSLSVFITTLKIGFLGRIGGLYVNANEAAYALVCGLWLGSHIIESSRWRHIFQIMILIAVLMTMSRSGLIALFITIIALGYQKKITILKMLLFFSAFVLIALTTLWVNPSSVTSKNLKARLEIQFNHQSESQQISLSGAAGERAQLAQDSIDRFNENIWLGVGIEPTEGESSHNELLSFISKHGVLGGVLFIAFWIVVLQAGLPLGLAIALFTITMFDHSFFYNRFILLTLACSLDFKGWSFFRNRGESGLSGSNDPFMPTAQSRNTTH